MRFSTPRLRAVRKYLGRDWVAQALVNFDDVSPFIRRHLKQFYFSLLRASTSSALGSYLCHTGNMGHLLAVFGAFVSFIGFYYSPPWKESQRIRFLMLSAFFGWASAAHRFSWFLGVDTGFVVTSNVATSVGFGCFWASSKWIKRFELVYFTALLLCSPLILISLLVTSAVFGGESAFWKYQLLSMLLWFMAYVAAYSQEVVMKARSGDGDYVKHSISLFIDFPAFVIHLIKELWKLYR